MPNGDLQARIDDLTWTIDWLSGLAQSYYDQGNDRGNLSAVARMERLWDEREELRRELRQASRT